ncbi:MAG: phenylacetate--CoA ligase family protein [Candidatus Paceibacterota bacterium]
MTLLTSKKDYQNLDLKIKKILTDYIKFAVNEVPFYSKFRNILRNVNYKNFFKFPITYDYDLINNPFSFVAKNSQLVQLASSGGTYGKRKLIFRTNNDIQKSVKTAISMFLCGGITPKDIIAILQPFDLWNIGHIALLAFREIGALSIPIGLSLDNETILNILAMTKCNIIYGTPSKIITLAELSKKQAVSFKIDKVFCAGEPILQVHRETIKHLWNAEIYGIYGSEETDGIGAECDYHCGYHIFDEFLVVEILHPKTLLPAEDNKGALVVTKLGYSGTVLLRYLLGDLVEITKDPCKCGRKEIRIFPKGRIKEVIWLYDGTKVPLQSIEDALNMIFGKIPQYQIIVQNISKGNIITLKILMEKDISIKMKKELNKILIKSSQDLEEGINKKEIKLFIESFKDPSKFVYTERGKIPKVIYKKYGKY